MESEEGSISPCVVDTKFGKVEGPRSPIRSPEVVHATIEKMDHVGPLMPV